VKSAVTPRPLTRAAAARHPCAAAAGPRAGVAVGAAALLPAQEAQAIKIASQEFTGARPRPPHGIPPPCGPAMPRARAAARPRKAAHARCRVRPPLSPFSRATRPRPTPARAGGLVRGGGSSPKSATKASSEGYTL
jgi:hypothetical protein